MFRSVISDIWETTAPGRIQEIRKTLLGLHPPGSEEYVSNIKPPATVEELRALEDFYRRQNPGKQMPTVPEKIQHWLYLVRNLVPAYWGHKGYSIELKIKVPEKVTRSDNQLRDYIQKYYPEEWNRLEFHFSAMEKHPPTATEYRRTSTFTYNGEALVIRVLVPLYMRTWDEIAPYLETNHPEELGRLNLEMDRIDARRSKELEEILLQG